MRFAITFDYLCPFAAIGNETVVTALADGADHEVSFRAFSLSQVHVEEGQPSVWDALAAGESPSGTLALQWGIAIRDNFPERFRDAHVALFSARHKHGRNINDVQVLRDAVAPTGVDVAKVEEIVAGGEPARTLRAEHTRNVDDDAVFGVPTWIVGDQAVFVRLMERPADGAEARATVDRVVDLAANWTILNEFKHTRVPR